MTRLTIRQLWAHKLRFALTGLAVVLGVAFMSGTTILTDTMAASFDHLFATANRDVDVVVQQPETVAAPQGGASTRPRVSAEALDQVRRIDGVADAVGKIDGFGQLVEADGTVASTDGLGQTIGVNWVDGPLNPFALSSGRAPATATEAVLDVRTADEQGWTVGDRFSVLTAQGPQRFTLVGTLHMGDIEGVPGTTVVATTDEAAQALFATPGHYDGIVATAADGVTPEALADRIDHALGAGTYEVITGDQDTAAQQDRFRQDMAFMANFLMAFAFISLFVGVFIIANTFSIVVAQRQRDLAMLRAIGAGRSQVLRSVLLESAVVGVVAGAVGLLGGVATSLGLRALLRVVGLDLPSAPLVIQRSTIVTAFVVGVVVTVASAVGPALRAGRIAPIAALRASATDRSATSKLRTAAGLAVTGAGVGLFVAGATGTGSGAVRLLGLGVAAVVAGIVVLGPVLARPVVSVLSRPLPALKGTPGRLAGQNARRNPKRTAATATALMIGVALVGFITIVAASTERSVEHAVDRSLRADYVVESGSWGDGGFSPELAGAIADRPEVAEVSAFRSTPVEVDGSGVELQAVDTATFDHVFDLGVTHGSLPAVTEGKVAVKDSVAADHGLAVGDRVDVRFPSGPATLTVAATYAEDIAGVDHTDYLVDLTTLEDHVADRFDRKIFVATGDGVSTAEGRRALDAVTADYPNATIQDQAEFKDGITSNIHQMLNLIYGLLALAVLIALLGIANTLALSVHERTRELGLLRAVGMSRRQVRTTIRWESVLIALLGTALGGLLAVGGAWGIVHALGREGVTAFVVPVGRLAVILVLAAAAGVLAALAPARRAARLDVLAAIATT